MSASASGDTRGILTYSTEITFLEELFTRLGSGTSALSHPTLTEVSRLLAQFLETALERGQADRIEKILGFQEILFRSMGDSLGDLFSDAIEIIPYTRLLPPLESPPSPPRGLRLVLSDKESLTCPVCWDDFPPFAMVTLHQCGEHNYCRKCMIDQLTSLIVDADVSHITCPHPACKSEVLECEVRELLDEDVYQKYLHFLVLAVLKEEKNARWCTNTTCGQPIIWDPQEKVVVCPACKCEFCFECSRPLHPGFSCAGQKLPDYEEQFQQWLQEKEARVKKCPGCQAPLEKNEGCNHMTCRCGAQWCWLCGERMEGQNHFGEGPCSGFQFVAFDTREAAVEDRERRAAEERAATERAAAEQREAERRAEEMRAAARAAAEERRRAIAAGELPTEGGPSCLHCGGHFASWSDLFSHTGMGQCPTPPAGTSRTVFMR